MFPLPLCWWKMPPTMNEKPPGTFWPLSIAIIFYALGFGLFRPLVDALFADITAGKERAGLFLYAFLEKKPLGPGGNLPWRKKESPSSSRIS